MSSGIDNDFLKVLTLYELKKVPRDSSNHYFDKKDKVVYKRRETVAEHVFSCLKLADYFFNNRGGVF